MNPQIFMAFIALAAAIYFIATLVALGRLLAGPGSLDRLISLDSLVNMTHGMLCAYMVWSLDTSAVYAMLVIALLGFISSLAVASYRRRDHDKEMV